MRFLLAGAYNTVFGYAVFSLLFFALGRSVHYLLIGVVANFIAMVSAFIVHRTLVFRSSDRWQSSFVRFYVSQLVALGFGIAALYWLVEYGHFKPLVAQAAIMTASVALTYVLHRRFSFRNN